MTELLLSQRLSGRSAILAVAPSPGVEMDRRTLLNATQILAPYLRRNTLATALTDLASDHREPLVRVHRGVFTTRPAGERAA